MVWNNNGREYTSDFNEGLLLIKGSLNVGDQQDQSLTIPLLQIMKVHPEHPVRVSYAGRWSIRPKNDDRPIGDIQRDPNPKLYDGISLLFCPKEFTLSDKAEKTIIENGFKYIDGKAGPLQIGYIADIKALEIAPSDTKTVGNVLEAALPDEIHSYLIGNPIVYNKERLGRVNLEGKILRDTVNGLIEKLEKRFETRLRLNRY